MDAQHLIGRMVMVENSCIVELPTDVAGFYFEHSLYFPIAPCRYATRTQTKNVEPFEVEQFKLALPTATLLGRQLVWQEVALGLAVYQLEIMLAPTAIMPFHLTAQS